MNRYDMRQFDSKSYPWNEKGKKTAVHYIVWRWIVSILIMAGIVYMAASTKLEMLSFSGVLCEMLAFVALDIALLLLIVGFYRWKSQKLEPEAQHDFLLRIYQRNRNRSVVMDNLSLLGMAKIRAEHREYEACKEALALVKTEKLQQPDLKLYYKLQMDAAMYTGDVTAAEEWRVRFTGIQGEFPAVRKFHSIRNSLIFLFVSYLLAYKGLSIGLKEPYELRTAFQMCSALIVAVGGAVCCGIWIAQVWKRYKAWKQEYNRRNISQILLMVLLVIFALFFLIVGALGLLSAPEEREVRRDDKYVYLDVSTGYYIWSAKADNPFIRETYYKNSGLSDSDKTDKESRGSDTTGEESSGLSSDAADNGSSGADEADNGNTNSYQDTQSSNDSTEAKQYETEENEMNAVWQYLVSNSVIEDQGFTTDMDAKGYTYAVVGNAKGDRLVLKGNGSQTDDNGNACTEYALEQEGEDQTELLGFYLVNRTTLEVTDEHKTSW